MALSAWRLDNVAVNTLINLAENLIQIYLVC